MEMKNGTGLSIHEFDKKNRIISIEFDGILNVKDRNGSRKVECYRNDASILFFASNSYRAAFIELSRKIEKLFSESESRANEKEISHMILPYFFCFRQFIELEIKAYYVCLTRNSPELTHDLLSLFTNYKLSLDNYTYDNSKLTITENDFINHKDTVLILNREFEQDLRRYIDIEPSVEYYRYIFETTSRPKTLVLNHSHLCLEYNSIDPLLIKMCKSINDIRKELSFIVYTYYLI